MIEVRKIYDEVRNGVENIFNNGKINTVELANRVRLFLKYNLNAFDEMEILRLVIKTAIAKNTDFNKKVIEESVCGWIKKKFGIDFEKIA